MYGRRARPSAATSPTTRPNSTASAAKLVAPMLDECERALADGIVANADHVDAGVIFGTGFAPFRGGPLHYRRTQQEAGAPPRSCLSTRSCKPR